MPIRQPCALSFYRSECNAGKIERYLRGFQVPSEPLRIVAGVVPHAGWVYSGAVAAKVFACIREKCNPTTFVLFGAIHRWGVEQNSVYAHGSWITPFGEVQIDEDVAEALLCSMEGQVIENPKAHANEHSLEVQLPFIKYFFPCAKIVPIAMIPDQHADATGRKIGEVVHEISSDAVLIGTTDLTHYGAVYDFTPEGVGPRALDWLKQNDLRMIHLALEMRAGEIVPEARRNSNACGPGALAATVAAADAMGAVNGVLLEYRTSHDLSEEPEFRMGVGYVGIVY